MSEHVLPGCAPRRVILLAGEQAQMCDGHVDRGSHRRDIAGGLRQQIAALDSGHEPRSKLGDVSVLRNNAIPLKPAKEIFEEFLPSHEQVVELSSCDRVLIGNLVREGTQRAPVSALMQGIVLDECISPTSQARERLHVPQPFSFNGYLLLAHKLDHCPHERWLVFKVSVQLRFADLAR